MFYFLHRLVKWFFIALVCAGLYWVWLQREAIEPVYVWYDVYQNGGLMKEEPLQLVRGQGTHVYDGHTFQLMSGGRAYVVTLTGFTKPALPMPPDEVALEKERRRVLREAVLKKNVKVKVTFGEGTSLLGVVNAGGTNLNLYFLTNGLAKFNRDYIKSAPRTVQYQFFAAERMREKQREMALAMNRR